MKKKLFREEALHYQNSTLSGDVILVTSITTKALVVSYVLIFFVISIFISTFKYTSTETFSGQVVVANNMGDTNNSNASSLAIEIYIPPSAAANITMSQSVSIAYNAFPKSQFGLHKGNISYISNIVTPALNGEREPTIKARVDVTPMYIDSANMKFPLQPGMLLLASTEVETRTLLGWITYSLFSRKSNMM